MLTLEINSLCAYLNNLEQKKSKINPKQGEGNKIAKTSKKKMK